MVNTRTPLLAAQSAGICLNRGLRQWPAAAARKEAPEWSWPLDDLAARVLQFLT